MELAGAQPAHMRAVELRELREHDGVDRHVDADAERVGAADHRQQAPLRELFDETAVARKHAGVVDADAVAQQTLEDLAEGRRELRAGDGLGDHLALLLAGDAGARERLRGVEGGVLREVHDVDRRLVLPDGQLDGLLERVERVLVGQRHRARRVRDDVDVGVGHRLELVGDRVDVAERGAHQQELRLRQCEQRHLPRPAAFGVAVEMELVHRDAADVRVRALAQRLVREDLRRAADDRRLGVDMGVAGDHADVVAAEHVDEVEELLGDERLDRRRVVGAPAGAQRGEVHAERHERLSRAGRRVEDHMVAGEQVHDRLLLMRPRLDAFDVIDPREEALVDLVVAQWLHMGAPARRELAEGTVFRCVRHTVQSNARRGAAAGAACRTNVRTKGR